MSENVLGQGEDENVGQGEDRWLAIAELRDFGNVTAPERPSEEELLIEEQKRLEALAADIAAISGLPRSAPRRGGYQAPPGTH